MKYAIFIGSIFLFGCVDKANHTTNSSKIFDTSFIESNADTSLSKIDIVTAKIADTILYVGYGNIKLSKLNFSIKYPDTILLVRFDKDSIIFCVKHPDYLIDGKINTKNIIYSHVWCPYKISGNTYSDDLTDKYGVVKYEFDFLNTDSMKVQSVDFNVVDKITEQYLFKGRKLKS